MFNIFKRKKKDPTPEVTQAVVVNPSIPIMPMVTDLSEPVYVIDAEGDEWSLQRSENLVYLSGDDGLIQTQFSISTFRAFLREVNALVEV